MHVWKRAMWCFCLLAWSSLTASAAIVDRIVAQVNNEIITQSELEQLIKYLQTDPATGGKLKDSEAVRRQMLDVLIDRKLAKEEAKRLGLTVPEKDIAKALEEIKKRNNFPDDETLARQLAKDGMTMDMLRQQITESLQRDRLINVAVRGKVKIDEDDMRRFYETQFRRGSEAQIKFTVLEIPYPSGASEEQKEGTRSLAEKSFLDIRQGQSMDALAKKLEQEGKTVKLIDPGYGSPKALDPRLVELLDKLRPGEVMPIRSPNGFQLIKLVDRKGAGPGATYEQAKPEIQQILTQQEMEKKFSEWLKTLRQKASIKTFL